MSLSAELKRLSNISFQLEEENERLWAENEQLSQPKDPADDERVKELLDSLEENITDREKLIGNGEKIQRSINAYRALRPK